MNANKSKVNAMIDNSNRSGSQYMQQVMGGYDLADYVNSGGGSGGDSNETTGGANGGNNNVTSL
jgi:hypothetical protein